MDVGTLVARSTRKYRNRIAVESSEGAWLLDSAYSPPALSSERSKH